MKKTLLILISTTGFLSAQTTITKAFNDPIMGEIVNNVNINGTVDNSATGNNVTFTNTSLTAGSASSATYSTPSSTEISTFPGSTIKRQVAEVLLTTNRPQRNLRSQDW